MEVAIVGAGVAGLEAARRLAERGVDVAIFEASEATSGDYEGAVAGALESAARVADAILTASRSRAAAPARARR